MTTAFVIGIVAAFLALLLRRQQKEMAVLLGISASLLLFMYALADVGKVLVYLKDTADVGGVREEAEILLKALGIAAMTQITTDICKEAGETAMAGQVEMVGKAEILLLSLPLLTKLLGVVQEFLS